MFYSLIGSTEKLVNILIFTYLYVSIFIYFYIYFLHTYVLDFEELHNS
jgi:hypothetical protein